MLKDKIRHPDCSALVLVPDHARASRLAYDFFSVLPAKTEALFTVTDNRIVFKHGAELRFEAYSDDLWRYQGHRFDHIHVTPDCPLTHDTRAFLASRLKLDGELFVPS